jgi:hypothetical protein
MPAARIRPRTVLCAASLAAALCGAIPATAAAAAPPAWDEQAQAIAIPWPRLQEPDGHFRDYILARDPSDGRDDYGDPMLGYALLLTADRRNDATLADSGLRALERSLEHPARSPSTQVFHNLAVVSAYNLARTRFGEHPVFQRARERWEAYVRAIAPLRLRAGQRVTNKSIVEAVVLLEQAAAGLGGDAAGRVELVKDFLSKDLPRAAMPFERGGRAILGDLPLLPPAYHGLSVGMLGRAIALLGDEAPSAARWLLSRAMTASLVATAPNGDVAYYGRSQLTAWTLTLTGYGAEVAAGLPGPPALAPSFRRLANLTIRRLAFGYPYDRPEGFLHTPSLAQGIDAALPGLDDYVAATPYVGLTLATLEWAIAAAPEGDVDRLGSAIAGTTFVLGRGKGAWATARRGDVWLAVRPARTSLRDLRYDFGLVALKVRSSGIWYDAMPVRPRTASRDDTAGPLLSRGGSTAAPEATSLAARKGGGVVATGGFRTSSGTWVRRGVRFEYAPTKCGVRLSFPVKAGDRIAYSAFFALPPRRSGRRLRDARQEVVLSRDASVTVERGYSSGAETDLHRARIRFPRARRSGSISITTCIRP